MDPEVIKAAAQSTLGILALMVLVLSTVALAFFRDAPVWVRLVVFIVLFCGAGGFAASVQMAKKEKEKDWVGKQGYVYYGRNADGTPSDGGKLQLANGAPLPEVKGIVQGTIFKGVDVKQLREQGTNRSPALAQIPIGACYRAISVGPSSASPTGEGAWLQVQTMVCP